METLQKVEDVLKAHLASPMQVGSERHQNAKEALQTLQQFREQAKTALAPAILHKKLPIGIRRKLDGVFVQL